MKKALVTTMKYETWVKEYIYPKDEFELDQYINENFPWTKFVIFIDRLLMDSKEVKNWCDQSLIGKFDIAMVSYFELEEDSVLFALRWS